MTINESIRVNKVLKEFNIGLSTLVDFLKSKKIEIAETPSAKIDPQTYELIKKEFGKEHGKPVLKGALVQECAYVGENQLEALVAIKSREELIGDIIGLLQSPVQNVVSALTSSGGGKIAGIVKTLSEKE